MADRNKPEKRENHQQEADRQQHNQQESRQRDQKQPSQLNDASGEALDAAGSLNAFYRANFEAFSQAVTLTAQNAMAVQEELLEFMVGRMNKDMQMAESLMSGHIGGGVLNGQSEYLREMMQDYMDESQKLVERGLQLAKQSAMPFERWTDVTTRDIRPEQGQVAAE